MDLKNITLIKYKANFTCNDAFQMFNTTLIRTNCFTVLDDDFGDVSCNEECHRLNAKMPDYDELLRLNAEQVERVCGAEFCDLRVDVHFNFHTRHWQSNNKQLDNLTWKSHEFPRLNDLLVVCNHAPLSYGWQPSGVSARYCTKNSPSLDHNRTNFVAWQYMPQTQGYRDAKMIRNHYSGYYLCETDTFHPSNLKMGFLAQAVEKCDEIMTLDLCEDANMAEKIRKLVNDAQRQYGIEPLSFMWTGTRRYNATHFQKNKRTWPTNFESCRSMIISEAKTVASMPTDGSHQPSSSPHLLGLSGVCVFLFFS